MEGFQTSKGNSEIYFNGPGSEGNSDGNFRGFPIRSNGDTSTMSEIFFKKVELTAGEQGIVNTLINAWHDTGVLDKNVPANSKVKVLYIYIGGTDAKHAINVINPDLFETIFNGGWTHSATGSLPNAVNGFGDTQFNERDELTLNSTSIGIYSGTSASGNIDLGVSDASQATHMGSRRAGDVFRGGMDSAASFSKTGITDGAGFFVFSRLLAANWVQYINGSAVQTNVDTSSNTANRVFYLGAFNNAGTASNFSNKELRLAFISDGLNSTEISEMNTAVQAYQTSLGRNV